MLWEKDFGMVNVYKDIIFRFYRDFLKKERKKKIKKESIVGGKKGNGMGKWVFCFYNFVGLLI